MKRFAILLAVTAATAGPAILWAQSGPISGVDQTGIDKTVKPGDGFDRYANGAWRARTEIPADRSTVGVGYDVSLIAEARNAAIIQGQAGAAPGSNARRIADYHAAFLDTVGIEARGLTPLKPQLDAIGAIADKRALARAIGATLRADTDPLNATDFETENLFGLFVTQDLQRPTVTVPYLLQGGLGLPERDYYLSTKPDMVELRTAYGKYVAEVMGLAGYPNAEVRAASIIALETRIAQAHFGVEKSQDARNVQSWRRGDFARRAPGLDWPAFWTAAQLPRQQRFSVWQPAAVTGIAALVASEPLSVWKDWLAFHRINQLTSVLPRAYDDARFAFYGKTLNGTPAQQPRARRGIAAVNGALGDAVGRIYAQRHFPASSRTEIKGMVSNIVAAFDRRVAGLDWMAPTTKAEARRKLQVLVVGVGYGDKWRSYAGFAVRPDDALGNMQRAGVYEYRYQLAKIGRPVDRNEWWMTPQTVNAVNLPLQNALNFPAAILESPYFDARFDAAANYGAIGAVIGHEIVHSFDNLGADFDSTGRLRNWWTPADLARFGEAGKALADQYSAYEALPGLRLNGTQTLGENIADVAGLSASYDAYRASLGGREAPVVGGLTGDQRFFLAYARAWRTKMRDRSLRARIATGVHSPPMWRVETVRNLDAWYGAFGVAPGQALYLAPTRRVKVW